MLGKGIGFTSKATGLIDAKDPRIEKRFRLDDRDQMSHYQSILEDIDPQVIHIPEQIIEQIRSGFTAPINNKAYFVLPSHTQFAIHRLKNRMEISNPFL
ncbi:PRD domain-containing protein [Paenibacillus rigui]|uniref:PRD domain-containing protein n=1 Tax=Paenibacillus rigui TaxID=554312 RepID=UPI002481E2EC|nr:PRD domain-containing protein [Paenibacillus rigui]